jgi:lipid II:glycine glycyltransferase (peptidoglycan interpeptide bridge formation enzyme)
MMNRDEYIEKLKAQLDLWNAEAAKWEAKVRMAQAGMRAEYEKQFESFKHQRDEALKKMQQIQGASGDAWVELVRGADDAWAKMRETFEKSRSHFHKNDE